MTDDRRTNARINLRLPVKWDGISGRQETRIDDISLSGCFVNTGGRVELNEEVDIEIELPSGDWLLLSGTVTSFQPGIGFGLAFRSVSAEEEDSLRQLIEVSD